MSEDRLSVYDAVEERGFFFYSGANGDLCRKNGLGGWRLSIAHSWLAIQKKNKYGRWKTKFKVEDADVLPGGRRDGVSREQKLRFLEKVDELLENETIEEVSDDE